MTQIWETSAIVQSFGHEDNKYPLEEKKRLGKKQSVLAEELICQLHAGG
jgi:hypothetical protein